VAGRGAMEAISIPTAVILARLLSPHDFGVAAAAGFFVMLAQRVTNFGFNVGLVRLTPLTEAHSATVFFVTVALGGVAWAVLGASAAVLASFVRSPDAGAVIPAAALAFLIGALGSVPQALLTRQLRFKEILVIETIAVWVGSATAIGLAWWGARYWSLVYSQIVTAAVSTTLKFVWSGWWPRGRFSWEALKELSSFAFGVHVKRLLEAGAANLDNLMIARLLGVMQLGLYDKAFSTMSRASSLVSALGPSVSFSVLAKFQNDPDRFRLAHQKITLATALLSFPLFAVLACVAEPLFWLMFGSQWLAAVGAFRILCIVGMLKLAMTYLGSAAEAQGRVWGMAGAQVAYVVLIVTGVAVGSAWGLTGAAGGVLAATLVVTGLTCEVARRSAGFRWSEVLSPYVPGIVCAGVLVVVVWAASGVVGQVTDSAEAAIMLALQAGSGLLGYAAFLALVPIRSVRGLVRETMRDLAFDPRGRVRPSW